MQAPICANSFTAARRSEPRHQGVAQRGRDGERGQRALQRVTAPRPRAAAPTRAPTWSTPRRTAARRRHGPGSPRALRAAAPFLGHLATSSAPSLRPRPVQGERGHARLPSSTAGVYSGRCVITSRTGSPADSGPGASSNSWLVGSIQWASSTTIRTGCPADKASICADQASSVFSFCFCGERFNGG